MRNGRTSTIRAPLWRSLVRMPAWLPVNDTASMPSSVHAIASSDIASRSPQVSSMSSSRRDGDCEIDLAFSISWLVVLPIADTTTTTFLPAALVRAMRAATCLILSASATDEPPYFCTTIPVEPMSGNI